MDLVYSAPFMAGFYNILSILLGLAAIGFGIHSFAVKGCLTCCTVSFGCCAGALLCQLLEVWRRVELSDWSALMDTMDVVIVVSAALLICTLAVNLFALYRARKPSPQNAS